MTNPKIYIACLASYNKGFLYGTWIDATQDIEIIHEEIQAMLSVSPSIRTEGWVLYDCKGFNTYQIDECDDLQTICEIARLIVEHGSLGIALHALYGDIEYAKEALENYYHGAYDSELEFARQLFDDCYSADVPESIKYYIDYKAFCTDIFLNDFFSLDVDGYTHIFSEH